MGGAMSYVHAMGKCQTHPEVSAPWHYVMWKDLFPRSDKQNQIKVSESASSEMLQATQIHVVVRLRDSFL